MSETICFTVYLTRFYDLGIQCGYFFETLPSIESGCMVPIKGTGQGFKNGHKNVNHIIKKTAFKL